MRILIVDSANVVGSRADGWWRDRPGAARRLADEVAAVELPYDDIVLVLEGQARRGIASGSQQGLDIVHADDVGDDTIVAEALARRAAGEVHVVTADRALRARVEAGGATTFGPSWLLDQL